MWFVYQGSQALASLSISNCGRSSERDVGVQGHAQGFMAIIEYPRAHLDFVAPLSHGDIFCFCRDQMYRTASPSAAACLWLDAEWHDKSHLTMHASRQVSSCMLHHACFSTHLTVAISRHHDVSPGSKFDLFTLTASRDIELGTHVSVFFSTRGSGN